MISTKDISSKIDLMCRDLYAQMSVFVSYEYYSVGLRARYKFLPERLEFGKIEIPYQESQIAVDVIGHWLASKSGKPNEKRFQLELESKTETYLTMTKSWNSEIRVQFGNMISSHQEIPDDASVESILFWEANHIQPSKSMLRAVLAKVPPMMEDYQQTATKPIREYLEL